MEFFKELEQSKIFKSLTEFECQALMFCLKTRFKVFHKNEVIAEQYSPMEDVIMVVKGGAIVENIDSLGDITIVKRLKKNDTYGIESAYLNENIYQDSIRASEKSLILFMNKHRLITPCENRCIRHEIIIRHLTQILAENSDELNNKLTHMSKKTIREKLLSYFYTLAKDNEYFELPFNKTELANYLSVDRSAMSTELSRMRDAGLIDFDKRQFRLIKRNKK